jgi:hypothetical protein
MRERWLARCSAQKDWEKKKTQEFFSAGTGEFLLDQRDILSYTFLGLLAKIKCSIISWLLVPTMSYII